MSVALYLMTSPHSNMIGLYRLPIAYISADLGIPFEGASKGLERLSELGFCRYDTEQEVVWVVDMARHDVGANLKAADNRVSRVEKLLALHHKSFLSSEFRELYGSAYNLELKPLRSPFEAPSKPLRSQEQEQEQDTEQEQEQENGQSPRAPAADDADQEFDLFWAAQLRKANKPAARRAWKAMRKKGKAPSTEELIEAYKRQAEANEWGNHKHTPHPSTWLNGERWEDDIPEPPPDRHRRHPSTGIEPLLAYERRELEERGEMP